MSHAARGLLIAISLLGSTCRHREELRPEPSTGAADTASADHACSNIDPHERYIDASWSEGSRTFACFVASLPSGLPDGERALRDCMSVDRKTGVYRVEASTLHAPEAGPIAPSPATLSDRSRSKDFEYAISGGFRTPPGATQVLVDTATKKRKVAVFEYDEHVEHEGYLGHGVVIRTWLDEGPACRRKLFEPTKHWPVRFHENDHDLGSCEDGAAIVVAPHDRHLFVSAEGTLLLVDDATLAVTSLDTRHVVPVYEGSARFRVVSGDGEKDHLLLVYATSEGADVVDVDLDRGAIARIFTPPICASHDAAGDAG